MKIFGHKSPDTDSTCAPIVWAWYLTEHGHTAKPYLLGQPNTEAAFVLQYWKMAQPEILGKLVPGEDVVIVDTNNPQELPDDIGEANVVEIIDHHKLVGGLQTTFPPKITIRPLACTTTVMYEIMDETIRENLPREIAGLMLSAILSDTLAFRSPTTTETDKAVAKKLAENLSMDIDTYANEMFAAKSDISHFSDEALLRLDSKKYEVGGKNFRVSVLETTSPATVLERKASLMSAMETVATEDGVDQVLLFVIDILNETSTLLVPNEFVKMVAEKSFNVKIAEDTHVFPNLVSRKKQIIPNLTV